MVLGAVMRAAGAPRNYWVNMTLRVASYSHLPNTRSVASCCRCAAAAAAAVTTLMIAPIAANHEDHELLATIDGRTDSFGGVNVSPAELPSDPAQFRLLLSASIKAWQASARRGVWLKISNEKAALIPVAIEYGFDFHHAEAGYAMLNRWLPTDCVSPLPPNASHQVGVGAIVINPDGQVLLVQEAVGPTAGKGIWKIPTGLLEAGEDIPCAAERECLEETGVVASFERVVGFRHAHGALHGKSDLFFVCILRTDCSCDFQLQAAEIAAAKWEDWSTFMQQAPYPRDSPLWSRLYSVCCGGGDSTRVGQVAGLTAEKLASGSRPGDCYIYHAADDTGNEAAALVAAMPDPGEVRAYAQVPEVST